MSFRNRSVIPEIAPWRSEGGLSGIGWGYPIGPTRFRVRDFVTPRNDALFYFQLYGMDA